MSRARGPRGARVPWAACALTALLFSAPGRAAGLAEQIEKLLDASPATRAAFWGIQIVDLGTGQTLYELNPDRSFVPASNVKLFTAALALARLGPDYRFQTRVLAAAAPDAEGVLRGPLVLAGGGDPNLSGRALPYRMGAPPGNALAALEDLANQVAARGVKRVEGEIVGDDRWYVRQPYPDGWAIDDPQYDFGAPVSALAVSENTLTLTVGPGARAGDPAALVLDPAVEFYSVENRLKTVAPGGERRIQFERAPGGRQIRLWGSIPLRDRAQTLSLGIEDPARYAALAFRQALESRGIAVTGGVAARYLYPDEVENIAGSPGAAAAAAAAPAGQVELASRASAPLLQDLQAMQKASLNLHAEMALRALGRARRGVGSLEAGLAELGAFLEEAGIDPGACRFADGSGLARLNLVTPAAVLKLLRFMYASPMRDNWMSLLPVAGQDGTLGPRFGGSAAAGRVFAKTGTMSHVSALSGYAQKADGGWAAFSILANNFSGPAAEIRGVADSICNLIVE